MGISMEAANALESAIDGKIAKAAAKSTRANGTVTRIGKDGTPYVQLDGSDTETPAARTAAAVHAGERVGVTVSGGSMAIDGNWSDPATGARHTAAAIGKAVKPIVTDIAKAQEAADEAQAVADATNQHFFADESGVHVTEAEGDATTEHNILINSLGILLRKAANHLVSVTQSAIAFYDGLGNAASNIVAQFGANGARIGSSDRLHVEFSNYLMSIVDSSGEYVTQLIGSDTPSIKETLSSPGLSRI